MRKFVIVLFLTLLMPIASSYADQVPEEALDQDYDACLGDAAGHRDPQRIEYCNCVRDEMRSWDMTTYGNLVQQQAKEPNTPSAVIEDIAKSCIAKVLHQ